jgi:hypothetical protein
MWSTIATSAAICAGCPFGRLTVPLPSLMRFVSCDAGDESEARRDRLAHVGHVLADERLAIAQPVRQQHRLAVLLQRLRVVAPGRMHGHREETKLH